jgi:phosphoglucosamine mutase
MKKLFGTDGVRGVANQHPLTSEMAIQIGRATAYIFKNSKRRHLILIGKDTRLSGYMIEQALASGICSMGVDVLLVGPLPTPAIAFLTTSMRADAGIMISASHNPFQDNGIKIFSRDGFKLPDEEEERIEELILSGKIDSLRPTASSIGKAFRVDDAKGRYIVHCKNTFPADLTIEGMKVILDCANGAAYKVAPIIFHELGAEVMSCCVDPNGENINKKCGALSPEKLVGMVKRHNADLGIAFDGDADRVVFVDENGEVVDGDAIMAINGVEMLRNRTLKKKTLVATVMSNMGLELLIKKHGGKMIRERVGDRYVVEAMREGGYNFGGEQSGHLVFMDHATTGDGIISALQVLSSMIRSGRKLSELAMILERLPQVLINVPVKEKPNLDEITPVRKAIEKTEKKLKNRGRILVRYSGTEMLARVMIEGRSQKEINGMSKEIAGLIRREIG